MILLCILTDEFTELTHRPGGKRSTAHMGSVTGTFLDVNWPVGIPALSVRHGLYRILSHCTCFHKADECKSGEQGKDVNKMGGVALVHWQMFPP